LAINRSISFSALLFIFPVLVLFLARFASPLSLPVAARGAELFCSPVESVPKGLLLSVVRLIR
jgi:hypothetical protein